MTLKNPIDHEPQRQTPLGLGFVPGEKHRPLRLRRRGQTTLYERD